MRGDSCGNSETLSLFKLGNHCSILLSYGDSDSLSGTVRRLQLVPWGRSMKPRKPLGDGVFHQVTLAVQVELRHDPLAIGGNGGFGQREDGGDFFVR